MVLTPKTICLTLSCRSLSMVSRMVVALMPDSVATPIKAIRASSKKTLNRESLNFMISP